MSRENTIEEAIILGFLYGIQSEFLPTDEVEHRVAGFKRTKGFKEAAQAIEREKLKGQIAELKHLEGGTDYWLDNGEVIFVRDRISELQAQLDTNQQNSKKE